jgi:KRAB domain-containing zinc finger protein
MKTNPCNLCLKTFNQTSNLNQHILQCHTGERPFKCDHLGCEKRFSSSGTLSRHSKTHSFHKTFNCDFLQYEKSYNNQSNLRRHKLIHTKYKAFICPNQDCSKKFNEKGNMKKHIKEIHTPPDHKPFNCKICIKKFKTEWYLKAHLKTHETNREKIECPHCTSKFSWKTNINRHIQDKHSGKIHKCKNCEKSFATSNGLHLRIKNIHQHSPAMKNCYFCRNVYKTNSNLFLHLKIHTKERPFKFHCKKTFTNSSSLNKHMVIKLN